MPLNASVNQKSSTIVKDHSMERCISTLSPVQTDATLLAISQHCWMLHVASDCTPPWMFLRVVGSCYIRLHTTTLRTQQLLPLLAQHVGSCCVRLHIAKRLTGFKLCATTCNRGCASTSEIQCTVTLNTLLLMMQHSTNTGRKSGTPWCDWEELPMR